MTARKIEIAEVRIRPTRIELVDGAVIELSPNVVSVSTDGSKNEVGETVYTVHSNTNVSLVTPPRVDRTADVPMVDVSRH